MVPESPKVRPARLTPATPLPPKAKPTRAPASPKNLPNERKTSNRRGPYAERGFSGDAVLVDDEHAAQLFARAIQQAVRIEANACRIVGMNGTMIGGRGSTPLHGTVAQPPPFPTGCVLRVAGWRTAHVAGKSRGNNESPWEPWQHWARRRRTRPPQSIIVRRAAQQAGSITATG